MAESYRFMIVNKWGQVLERDGTFYRCDSGHEPFSQEFVDSDSARRFAGTVVREHPYVACDIIHGDRIVLQYFDEKWRQADEEETRGKFAEMRRRDRRIVTGAIAVTVFLLLGVLIPYFR